MNFPIGPRDVERWTALRRLGLLNSPADPGIDSLCKIVQRRFGVPIVLVSLIDKDEQLFKAHCGWDVSRTPRALAFCNFTILSHELFVVSDTLADTRFSKHPLVIGSPFIRSYVGAPLSLRGELPIGALCVVDVRPREWSNDELSELKDYASFVMKHLELYRSTCELEMELAKTEARRALIASQADAIRRRTTVAVQTERLAGIGGWEVELATDRITWSDNLYEILELSRSTSIDRRTIYAGLAPDGVRHLEDGFRLSAGQSFEFELPLTTAKGNQRWIRASGRVEYEGSEPKREIGIFHDVTQRHEGEARLLWHATHDELTDLPNRVLLQQLLKVHSSHPDEGCALLRIDIDHFRDVNETFGIDIGDSLLIEVGRKINLVVPSGSTVFRLGDDEFAILLEGETNRGSVQDVAESILNIMREDASSSTQGCRVSIGVTLLPDDGGPAKALRNAGLALQKAKAEGRDRFVFFDSNLDHLAKRRVEVLQSAREALDRKRVFPFYQPIFALDDRRLIGFEALMRWQDAGVVQPPGMLAEAFDDASLAVRIGEVMLEQVVGDLSSWRSKGLPFGHVAINASAAEFRRLDYASRVLNALAERNLPTECLEVEVTETVFLDRDAEAVLAALIELEAAGVATALDDFGTGFASLTHLRKFPVRWLKIDRSFVSELESDRNAAAIVETVIALGKSMGIGVIAEGVETPGQLEFLACRKCDRVQGFLLGKPMSSTAAESLLRSQS